MPESPLLPPPRLLIVLDGPSMAGPPLTVSEPGQGPWPSWPNGFMPWAHDRREICPGALGVPCKFRPPTREVLLWLPPAAPTGVLAAAGVVLGPPFQLAHACSRPIEEGTEPGCSPPCTEVELRGSCTTTMSADALRYITGMGTVPWACPWTMVSEAVVERPGVVLMVEKSAPLVGSVGWDAWGEMSAEPRVEAAAAVLRMEVLVDQREEVMLAKGVGLVVGERSSGE